MSTITTDQVQSTKSADEAKATDEKATEAKAKAAKAKAAAAAAKAKAAKAKAEEDDAEVEDGGGEEEVDTSLEGSAEWAKAVTDKIPASKKAAEELADALATAGAKEGVTQIEQGLNWLRLRSPLRNVGEDDLAYMQEKRGICSRKMKDGTVKVYNGLGLLGYENQEQAAEAMGLASRSPRTGKVLMRKLSTCILSARAHLTLLASGVEKGLNNAKLTGSLRTALLASGVQTVEDHAGMVQQLIDGEITEEDVTKSIVKSAKAKSKRGIASIGKTKTPDLVKQSLRGADGFLKYNDKAVRPRLSDVIQRLNAALNREDLDEEQQKAINEKKHEIQKALAEDLGVADVEIKL